MWCARCGCAVARVGLPGAVGLVALVALVAVVAVVAVGLWPTLVCRAQPAFWHARGGGVVARGAGPGSALSCERCLASVRLGCRVRSALLVRPGPIS